MYGVSPFDTLSFDRIIFSLLDQPDDGGSDIPIFGDELIPNTLTVDNKWFVAETT